MNAAAARWLQSYLHHVTKNSSDCHSSLLHC